MWKSRLNKVKNVKENTKIIFNPTKLSNSNTRKVEYNFSGFVLSKRPVARNDLKLKSRKWNSSSNSVITKRKNAWNSRWLCKISHLKH